MPEILFTPGPLTTTKTVKEAMIYDMGSRDGDFIGIVQEIRELLLSIVKLDPKFYTSILLPGSGTYGIESVLSSITPKKGCWLVINNGAYGSRIIKILGSSHLCGRYARWEEKCLFMPKFGSY